MVQLLYNAPFLDSAGKGNFFKTWVAGSMVLTLLRPPRNSSNRQCAEFMQRTSAARRT